MPAKTYRIETERLLIRCYDPADAHKLKKSIDESIEHLRPWMPWSKNEPEPLSDKIDRLRKFRGEFDLGIDYAFGIFSADEQYLIGSTGLHTRQGENEREIGYWIGSKYINQGFATEAVTALIIVGFEIENLDRIVIKCAPDNIKSRRIPHKLGFNHEATHEKSTTDANGNLRDDMIWALKRKDYSKEHYIDFTMTAFDILNRPIKTADEK